MFSFSDHCTRRVDDDDDDNDDDNDDDDDDYRRSQDFLWGCTFLHQKIG